MAARTVDGRDMRLALSEARMHERPVLRFEKDKSGLETEERCVPCTRHLLPTYLS